MVRILIAVNNQYTVFHMPTRKTEGAQRLRTALNGAVKAAAARELGISRQSLNNIMRCHQRPTIDQVDDIRRLYQIPISAWRRPEKPGV